MNPTSLLHPSVAAWFSRQFSTPTAAQAQAWRDGELLVMRNGATAPKRCVKCNAPAQEPPVPVKLQTGQMDQTNSYNMSRSDGMKAIDAISGIVDAANALSSIRRATVNVYVCEAHRPQRRTSTPRRRIRPACGQ